MTLLPNGCSFNGFSVSPKNWDKPGADFKKDWLIYYTFFDPEHPKGRRRQIRGMNVLKDLAGRRRLTRDIMTDELDLLQSGFNPIKAVISPEVIPGTVSPDTPFIQALQVAFSKVQAVDETLIDMRSVVKGVEAAATELGFAGMPVKAVSRKYFKLIFEQCRKTNPRFSAKRQNKYRAYLMRLFRELIELEAVEANPLRDIAKEREIVKARVLPTLEERDLINAHLRTNFYPFWRAIQMFFGSGAREIEMFRLQGKHVDLANQRCLYVVKKGQVTREVWRPIADELLPLWVELLSVCRAEDFLFAKGLLPGAAQISAKQFGRRWRRHVKLGLGINVDLYALKHLNTTELMDSLDGEAAPAKEVVKLTGHTNTAMVVNIYDRRNKDRKDDKIKRAGKPF